jgi:hypothetical protein
MISLVKLRSNQAEHGHYLDCFILNCRSFWASLSSLGAAHGWISWYVSSSSDESIVIITLWINEFVGKILFYGVVFPWCMLIGIVLISAIFCQPQPGHMNVTVGYSLAFVTLV